MAKSHDPDPDERAAEARRALAEFLTRLARAVVDGLRRPAPSGDASGGDDRPGLARGTP